MKSKSSSPERSISCWLPGEMARAVFQLSDTNSFNSFKGENFISFYFYFIEIETKVLNFFKKQCFYDEVEKSYLLSDPSK